MRRQIPDSGAKRQFGSLSDSKDRLSPYSLAPSILRFFFGSPWQALHSYGTQLQPILGRFGCGCCPGKFWPRKVAHPPPSTNFHILKSPQFFQKLNSVNAKAGPKS